MTHIALALLAVAATFAPAIRRITDERRVEARRTVALPELVDLLRLSDGAGSSLHQSIRTVADHAPEVFDAPLRAVERRVDRGERLGDALVELDGCGESTRPLVAALRAASFDGVPLGPALDRVAVDARLRRRRAAEIEARRLPVQLLFPLIVCILPAFGLLTVVPLLLSSMGDIHL